MELPRKSTALVAIRPDYDSQAGNGREWRVWHSLLNASLALPGSKIDRSTFLRDQLQGRCPAPVIEQALQAGSIAAGVSEELINRLADTSIRRHVLGVSAISFVTGLPGGWWIAGSIPADLVQFYWHAIVLSQKLAYLYGWPDLFGDGSLHESEGVEQITLLIGAMMGDRAAYLTLTQGAKLVADELAVRLPRLALSNPTTFAVARQVGNRIGAQLTNRSLTKLVVRFIPIVGGIASASASAALIRSMAKKLQFHLMPRR